MLLKATGTTVVSATLAGCANSQSKPDKAPADKTVTVGAYGSVKFAPENFTITTGTTVAWEWKSANHNIVVNKQPDGANWKGTPGGKGKTYNKGYRYTHTFDVPGKYHYYCNPHRSLGMVGSVTVKESTGDGGSKKGDGKKASGDKTSTTGNGN